MQSVKITPYGTKKCVLSTELTGDTYQKLIRLPGWHDWKPGTRDMMFRPTANNIRYINENWPDAIWEGEAQAFLDQFIFEQLSANETLEKKQERLEDDGRFEYKTKPFDHQRQLFLLSRALPCFAYFMQQGTGKSKPFIDTSAWLYSQGMIKAVIVLAPNGVHSNWIDNEIPAHMPEWCPYVSWEYSSKLTKKMLADFDKVMGNEDALKIFAFNIEGFVSDKAKFLLERIRDCFGEVCLIGVDESQYIKNHSAGRTKYLTKACEPFAFKRIMTGTSVTKGVEDLYGQFSWLSKDILGFDSFYTFRNHFCTMGGYEMKQIVGYKNLDELTNLIKPHSFRITKEECLDLPPKLYKRWLIELTPTQRRLYDELKNNFITELEGAGRVGSTWAMVRMLRLQQISCGWFPTDEDGMKPIPGDNPRLEAVRQHCFDTQGKVIVWARFTADIELITEQLKKDHGKDSVASYYGKTSQEDRMKWVDGFQNHDLNYLVCHAKAAGRGLTLTRCENPIYHSQDYDLELRLQSEDRTHRIGTTGSVTYTDVTAKKTLDIPIVNSLIKKKNLADIINNDPKTLFLQESETAS